jgi:hypothetical protein
MCYLQDNHDWPVAARRRGRVDRVRRQSVAPEAPPSDNLEGRRGMSRRSTSAAAAVLASLARFRRTTTHRRPAAAVAAGLPEVPPDRGQCHLRGAGRDRRELGDRGRRGAVRPGPRGGALHHQRRHARRRLPRARIPGVTHRGHQLPRAGRDRLRVRGRPAAQTWTLPAIGWWQETKAVDRSQPGGIAHLIPDRVARAARAMLESTTRDEVDVAPATLLPLADAVEAHRMIEGSDVWRMNIICVRSAPSGGRRASRCTRSAWC